jgi:glycosyltransferase involved in cell wall biosynthesis
VPFFSIIIPTYNRSKYLLPISRSIQEQSFGDFELIIIDDGSTDDTATVAQILVKDSRIIYEYQANQGVCAARNKGAVIARGEYLIFLDSDDNITNSWLEDFYQALNSSGTDIAFCGVKMKYTDGREKIINPRDPYHNGKDWGVFLAGSFAIKKTLFLEIGMYDPMIKFGENTELSYRIKSREVKAAFVDKANLLYNPSTSGGSKNLQNKVNSNIYILEKHKDWFEKRPESKMYYLQTSGIACYKLNKIPEARTYLKRAWMLNPMNAKNALRLMISNIPFLARLVWQRGTRS